MTAKSVEGRRSTGPAAPVMPLRHPAPHRVNWEEHGLPESGLVLLIDLMRCAECQGDGDGWPCVDACAATHNLPRLTRGEGKRQPLPKEKSSVFLPPTCAQCEVPPCAEACPVGAVSKTAEGVVLVDQEMCIGCKFCLDSCPLGALRYVDEFTAATPPLGVEDYSPGRPTGLMPRTVAKCTLCTYRVEQGELPVCVDNCPVNAIYVGNLDRDTAVNGEEVVRLTDLLGRREHVVRKLEPAMGGRIVYLM